ncbi:fumarylacetoacetate hydrolase family protein [Bacillus piscicola]|uniref:fumarylacetoacetate hydrolase family protein n=1 Tax=Bacillus piscicola TaxID=1632684 RepID=UPI001F0984A7|nr:fumarylacetoacetate hydrolase family protein [Bacillus piscicola]
MKLVTASIDGQEKIAALIDETTIVDLKAAAEERASSYIFPGTMLEAIVDGEQFIKEARETVEWVGEKTNSGFVYNIDTKDIVLRAPLPKPQKNIMCAGKNYADHAKEMGSEADIPTDPIIFTKSPTTVIAADELITPHREVTDSVDYEGEIALIIGKKGNHIQATEAHEYIFGYTLLNDVTARDIQKRHKQFFLGKSLDTFCPMGPAVVLADDVNIEDVTLKTWVNDELRQEASTKDLIFSVPKLIEIISRGMTLEPGDIIATGTPAGVGAGFQPPKFLRPGDQVTIEVEQIGRLSNKVARD